MRLILWLVALLALLYGGYWFAASRSFLAGTERVLAPLRAEGTVDYADLTLAGFPSRFDLTVTEPRLVSRDRGAEWRAPFLQIFALSYRPNRLIAVWPDQQWLDYRGLTFSVTSQDMRASAAFGAARSLPLDHAEFAADELVIGTAPDRSVRAERTILASRRTEGPASHQVALVVTNLSLAPGLRAAIDPRERHPATLPSLSFDAIAELDRPLELGQDGRPPRLTALRAILFKADWGTMRIAAQGELARDADGFAAGRIEIEVRDWREVLALAVNGGLLDADDAARIEGGFQAIARESGDETVLRFPLVLKDGLTRFGIIPIGPAPRL
jgi:hypothetical protein